MQITFWNNQHEVGIFEHVFENIQKESFRLSICAFPGLGVEKFEIWLYWRVDDIFDSFCIGKTNFHLYVWSLWKIQKSFYFLEQRKSTLFPI